MAVLKTIPSLVGVDHGGQIGLLDDDHTIYLLADGTRTLTGNLLVSALVTIDGRDISVDGTTLDTHLAGGSNLHDASEIDVEGTYAQIAGTPGDLETAMAGINTRLNAIPGAIWQRNVTTLSPVNAGDDLDMGAGNIVVSGTVDGRDVSTDGSAQDTHLGGGSNLHDASEIDVEGTYTSISITDLETVLSEIDTLISAGAGHRDGGSNKHDASEIDVEGTYTSISITDLETALGEIDTLISAGSGHRDGGNNKHDASEIDVEGTYTNLSTSDLETVISEIDNSLFPVPARSVLSGTEIDHSGDEIKTKTLSANPTTLTIANPILGRSILLEVQSGAAEALNLPGSVTVIGGGTYDASGVVNYIIIYCNNSSTPTYVATISKA